VLCEKLFPRFVLNTIFSIQNDRSAAIGILHVWCGRQILEFVPGFLATAAITRGCQNGRPKGAKYNLATFASDRDGFALRLVHRSSPFYLKPASAIWNSIAQEPDGIPQRIGSVLLF
jgi:hypothetical protein